MIWNIINGVMIALLVLALIIILSRRRMFIRGRKQLDEVNSKLLVANTVKEELFRTMFSTGSRYISDLEQYQQRFKENVVQRKYQELMVIPKNVDAHLWRINMTRQVDEMLVKIYPTFAEDFNALLREEERFVLKKGEILNTPMRIFGLVRLGIQHNDVLADIVDCSVNTVYTYRTRTIARSDLDADAFYEAIMQIPSFK